MFFLCYLLEYLASSNQSFRRYYKQIRYQLCLQLIKYTSARMTATLKVGTANTMPTYFYRAGMFIQGNFLMWRGGGTN